MLTTATRFVQAQDPTIDVAPVTAPAYPVITAALPCTATRPRTAATGLATANPWSVIGRIAMSKVDFHDRWPLFSTS